MKTNYWHVVSAFFLTLTLSFTPSLGSMAVPVSAATRHEVEYIEDATFDDFVPEGLEWPQDALKRVPVLAESSIADAQSTFDRLKAAGASSVTISSGRLLNDLPEFTRYEDLDLLNHESTLVGRGEWAAEVGKEQFGQVATTDWNSSLVGFTPGVCRLSWALLNWDTWFSPDCTVLSATPEQYLRVALASTLYYSDGMSSGAGYEILSSLEAISTERLPYEVRDGVLFAPELGDDWGFAEFGIQLVRPVAENSAGYEIEIDGQDPYHFIVRALSPTMQDLADRARVIEFVDQDGAKRSFVRFN